MAPTDRAAIFSTLCRRSQVRREAGLPFDMKAEYRTAVAHAELVRRRALYDEHRAEVRAEVLAMMRARHGAGWPHDLGGRYRLGVMVERTLKRRYNW